MSAFTQALANQSKAGFWIYGPETFRTYCRRHGLRADAASAISVDHVKTLSKELRIANTMVLFASEPATATKALAARPPSL